jgi:hypothetical protein
VRREEVETAYGVRVVEQVCYIEHYRQGTLRTQGRALSSEQAAQEWIGGYAAGFPRWGALLGRSPTQRKRAWLKQPSPSVIGSLGRARTADLVINSHPLYRLSYQGSVKGRHLNGGIRWGQAGRFLLRGPLRPDVRPGAAQAPTP